MTSATLVNGAIFGILVAAPVGPMALLCLTRTLRNGLTSGLTTGIGIASADGAFAAIAAYGFDAATQAITNGWPLIQIVGGAFLLFIAIRGVRAGNVDAARTKNSSTASRGADYLSAAGLTLTNPATILTFSAMFTGLVNLRNGDNSPGTLTIGVFLGSLLWWIVWVSLAAGLRQRLTGAPLKWITMTAAIALGGFGIFMLFRAAASMLA